MKEEEAIRSYFAGPGFKRFLKLLKRQYTASTEGVRGYVTLSNLSEVERETLDAFYGTYSPHVPGETKRYSLKKFEKLLLDSRFKITAVELLELLEGEPVLTRHEQDRRMSAEWESLIESALKEVSESNTMNGRVISWAKGLADESSPGSRILKSVFARSRDEASRCLRDCVRALNWIEGEKTGRLVRLPILAAEITGDAHALDWKNPLGRLFWWGLAACSSQQQPAGLTEDAVFDQIETIQLSNSQAMEIRDGYRRGGVADDDLSSQVMLYAPAFFGEREERVLTLRQVERLPKERLMRLPVRCIYMVENPSVFAELIDADAEQEGGGDSDIILICGNGQPTSAVLKLLDALLGNQKEIALYYAGDLDPAGLSIAQGLQLRYPSAFRAWRMDHELYERYAHRGMMLTEEERSRLKGTRYAWDRDLANMMAGRGFKLHQELWMHELVRDMKGN